MGRRANGRVHPPLVVAVVEVLLITSGAVALAEIGDKTQLLALMLAVRLRRPGAIVLGILVATLANHAIAAWAGVTLAGWVGAEALRWGVGLSFLVMAIWLTVPDAPGREPGLAAGLGPFLTTTVAFFLVEIGDKTQIATVALAARFEDLFLVTAGTTLGMLLANVPVVLAGGMIGSRIPLGLVRGVSAAVFGVLGVLTLLGVGVEAVAWP
jgi:putative Ca2+/H+ antiporter (TMEM165/GDT1 family)